MEIGEIISYIGTAVGGGAITQFANWKLNKKKVKEEVKSDEIENIRKSIDVYQTIIADQNKRISDLTEEVNTLRAQLRSERDEYQQQIQALQRQIVEITKVLGMKNQQKIRETKKAAK